MKVCKRCGCEKPVSEFKKDHFGINGISSRCRACINEVDREIRALGFENAVVRGCHAVIHKRQSTNTETCWLVDANAHKAVAHMLDGIGRIKPEFSTARYTSTFRAVRDNKAAKKAELAAKAAERKAERDANSAERKAAAQARAIERREAVGRARLARLTNGTVSIEDINGVLWERLRSHMKKQRRQKAGCIGSLTRRGEGIDGGMRRTLGYGIDDLRNSIEAQFEPWMSWESLIEGHIHIDHIIPASAFNLNNLEEFNACYALHNLQPLYSIDNIKKSNLINTHIRA